MARLARGEAALVATAAALVFTRVFGLSVVLPGFRAHYEVEFGAAPLWIGVALGAHGLTMALMQFPLGALSDRVGRRKVLLAGTLLFVAGSAWAALADSIGTLIAARLLQGVGTVSSVAMAAVGESVPAERRTQAMAWVGIPAGAGFFAGFLVGPLLQPWVGVPGLFWLTAGLGLLAGLPVLWAPFGRLAPDVAAADAAAAGASMVGSRARPRVRSVLGLSVLALAAAGFVNNYALQTVVFYLPHTSWERLLPPLLLTLVLVGGLSRRIDRAQLTWQPPALALLCAVAAVPFMVLDGAGSDGWGAWGFFGGTALFFTSHGVLSTSLPSQVSRLAGRSGGRGHGVQNVIAYSGTFAGGAVAGALAPHALSAVAVLAAVAVAASLLLVRALRPAAAAAAVPA